jgi:protein SCO1/2
MHASFLALPPLPARRTLRNLFALVSLCALAACSKPAEPWHLTDVSGHLPDLDFSLVDDGGAPVTGQSFAGKTTLVYFGYTHCPDVCPTTLAELSQAMQQLGDKSKDVQVLMVTVDPARDTPDLLGQYVAAFNSSYVGLRPANDAQLAQIAKDFRVYYAKSQGKTPDDYTMDHTAASYVFDKDGKLRLFARDGQGVEPWVHDLKLLVD